MPYAFDEFQQLLPSTSLPISDRDPKVRYLCALVSELTYHHVPAFEIDQNKRTKLIPCRRYQEIISGGSPTDVMQYLQDMDFANPFVIVDRGIIAVGISINNLLFIGFRGTKFLFDWKINLRAPLVDVCPSISQYWPIPSPFFVPGGGRVHQGFSEESVRITARILGAMKDNNIGSVDHIVLTGHSLGGAVAALCENVFSVGMTSICIFGSPRYCDASTYFSSPNGPPTQVQRPGDVVPFVPSRRRGYADHPYKFDTSGELIVEPIRVSGWYHWIWRWGLFLGKWLEPHCMESYRQELGRTAVAKLSEEPLTPYEKLQVADIDC